MHWGVRAEKGVKLTMGFWHTGYAEFREPSGLDGVDYGPPTPIRYECEHCGSSFMDLQALRRHRFEEHPLRQPLLLLRGKPVGTVRVKVLSPLAANDVALEDTIRCVLSGRSILPETLAQILAAMSHEFVELTLENDGATTRCEIDFAIAREQDLRSVEGAFVHMALDRVLSIEAVGRFIRDCRVLPTGMSYCDAICDYLYGVMAKDRLPDSGLEHSQYIDRFVRAADALAGIDRPLATTIRALIAFHFNRFEEAEFLAPEGHLREVAGAFAGLLDGLPWHYDAAFSPTRVDAVTDLLTDQDTAQVLSDAREGLVELKGRTEELRNQVDRPAAVYDRMKRVLLAAEALAAREDPESRKAARRLGRQLASQTQTRMWAEALLERLGAP